MLTENQILASFPEEVRTRLIPHLNHVTLARGDVLYRPGEQLTHLYFPIDCLISITITMQDGATAEVGIVGRREVLGIHAFLSQREFVQTEHVAQIPGSAVKIDAQIMQQEIEGNCEVYAVLLRCAQAFLAQVFQTAACNCLHTLEQRLPRWLLEVQMRVGSNELPLTQEFIALMLGVRRAGVTLMAQKLQERKLIQYQRGRIQILDQAGLEASACECFKTVRTQYDRLL